MFREFTLATTGKPVIVNSATIRYVIQHPSQSGTSVHFGEDKSSLYLFDDYLSVKAWLTGIKG